MTSLIAFVLIVCLLYYLSKKQIIQLSFGQVTCALILKIIAGCAYGYIYLHSNSGKDTWEYHVASLVGYENLKSGIGDVFPILPKNKNSIQLQSFFASNKSYWKDLSYNILISLLTIFNIISKGKYYVNVIFYNLITLWGHYLLFAGILKMFPSKKVLLFTIIFLFPPLIFWESGIHKDGLVFTFISGSIYCTTKFFLKQKIQWLLYTFFFLLLLILFRSFVGLTLLPFLIAYYLANAYKKQSLIIYASMLLLCIVLFFSSSLGPPFINFPKLIADRQAAFMLLNGGSFIPINTLEPTIKSYIEVLPTVLNHVFLRPYITEVKGSFQLFSFLETYFFMPIFCYCIINYNKFIALIKHPILLLAIFFCNNQLLANWLYCTFYWGNNAI